MNWSWFSFVAGILFSYLATLGVLTVIYYRTILHEPKSASKVLKFRRPA